MARRFVTLRDGALMVAMRSMCASMLVLLLVACDTRLQPEATGTLSLSVVSASSLAAVDSWRATVSNGPSPVQTQTGAPGGTITFTQLLPGTYVVTLEGLEGGEVVQRGETFVTVTAGANAPADITPQPVPATVSASATDAAASELGPDNGSVTLTRTGSIAVSLTVSIALSGSATNGGDYTSIPTSVVIPAQQKFVTLPVSPLLDAEVEGGESVIVTVVASPSYAVGTPSAATVTIADAPVVTIVASDASASEVGPDPGTFTVSRTGPTTSPLAVSFTVSGSASTGTDFAAPTSPVVIPAGQASAQVSIVPVADANSAEGTETITLTLAPNVAAYSVGTPAAATVTIEDTPPPLPVVTVSASGAAASEAGPVPGVFRISRTGATTAALSVSFTIGGSATAGTDYAAIASPQAIPAGAAFVDVAVAPLLDALAEGDETVILTLATTATYTLGAPAAATVTIADAPVVTIAATDASASEVGPDIGTLTISRTGATTAALTVTVAVSGTATGGADYTAIAATQVIPAGAATVAVTVTPAADALTEGNETVTLTLGASTSYAVGSPSVATVTIADTPGPVVPVVTVSATGAVASEAGPVPGVFRISRTGATTAALNVVFGLGGTATAGTDYAAIASPQVIPAGAAFVDVAVAPLLDALVEGTETVILTLTGNAAYTVGAPGAATVTIADAPVVTIVATDASASEVGPDGGTFTISRSGPTSAALTVTVTVSGTATAGGDYTAIASSQVIPAGAASVAVTVAPVADALSEGSETVVLTLVSNTAYAIGTASAATVTIADTPTPAVVSVIATDSVAHEAGSDVGVLTISRTGATTSALTVNFAWDDVLSLCQAPGSRAFQAPASPVTIPVGQSSVQVTVTPPLDTLFEGSRYACLDLQPGASYTVGTNSLARVRIADAMIAVEIENGDLHNCVRSYALEVSCWGNNTFGELGRGAVSSTPVTTPSPSLGGIIDYVEIRSGNYHTCGRTSLGRVDCWGYNFYGQIGNGVSGNNEPSATTVQAPAGVAFTSMAAGASFTCALSQVNAAYCWGYQGSGRLGNGSSSGVAVPLPTPVVMPNGVVFVGIAAGRDHACGWTGQGAAYCWGNNSNGQVGNNVLALPVTQPTLLQTALSFVQLVAGYQHTCGRTSSGDVYCWGNNQYGELGIGSTGSPVALPTNKANPPGVTFVEISSKGGSFTCGRTAAGAVYCWGNNFSGQIGNGQSGPSATNISTPALVSAGLVFQELSTGQETTCARTQAGTVYCWGGNGRGQVGDGTSGNVRTRPTPVEVR